MSDAERSLQDAHAAQEADQSVLSQADEIIEAMRMERSENNWATRVRLNFQQVRGAA